MEFVADGLVNLLTNGLVFFAAIVGGSFGLAIILFTIVTRVILYPLTVKQLRSTRGMQQLQPRIKELQEKYKNDRQRLQREQMRLFKEAGVNPIGCLGPVVIQFPIWIGLFYAIRKSLADTPESLISLSSKLYSWLPQTSEAIPLNSQFLGMDMGLTPSDEGGAAIIFLPLLVGGSMYIVQKMSTLPNADARQQSMSSMMTWMFPLMFGFWTLSFPIGLAVYWIGSNLVSIGLQYQISGWGGLARQPAPAPAPDALGQGAKSRVEGPLPEAEQPTAPEPAPRSNESPLVGFLKRVFLGSPPVAAPPGQSPQLPDEAPDSEAPRTGPTAAEKRDPDGQSRDDRQDGRRGYRQSAHGARARARRRRGRRR